MVCLYMTSEVGLSGLHTMCIGLGMRFREENLKVGYIKPVGHRYYCIEGQVTDEDAAFMRETLQLQESLDDLCPVMLTPQLVFEHYQEGMEDLLARVKEAFESVSRDKDVVIAQGAYTSLQGRFLGLSAYQLAPIFDAHVILVERFDDAFLADNVLAAKDDFGDSLTGVIAGPHGREIRATHDHKRRRENAMSNVVNPRNITYLAGLCAVVALLLAMAAPAATNASAQKCGICGKNLIKTKVFLE